MWTVAKIRADYEGWWLFSDWTEKIVEQHHYSNYEEMLKIINQLLKSKNIIIIMLLGNIIFMHFIIIVI